MDIEVYREFMALAAHKSFVSAARDLNMSQPSLSRHMNALSNDLGCRLFYDTRPLSLTAAGEVVLKHAGKIIGDQVQPGDTLTVDCVNGELTVDAKTVLTGEIVDH